jgi:hypothetical protein
MNPIAAWRLGRAARDFTRLLGPQLARDYGAGSTYAAPQIKAPCVRAGLDGRYLFLGDALFMTEAAFAAAWDGKITQSYVELRTLRQRYKPAHAASSASAALENSYAASGADGGV